MGVNAQYNVADAGSIAVRIAGHQRRKMYQAFLALGISPADSILDVGVTSDTSYDHSNYLDEWYPHSRQLTAVGVDAGAAFLAERRPGLQFVVADGCCLPFADFSFDFVHASAVLEHVGASFRQAAMLAEAYRVARKAVFLTTPNRWFPVEFHTVLPLVHWLPPPAFRALLRRLGRGFFASEDNLNLLSAADLRRRCRAAGCATAAQVHGVRLCGLVSNLLLVLKK